MNSNASIYYCDVSFIWKTYVQYNLQNIYIMQIILYIVLYIYIYIYISVFGKRPQIVNFSKFSSEDFRVLLFFFCLGQDGEKSTPY